MTERQPRILHLHGWQGSGERHWQPEWERLHGDDRVEQSDWLWPKRGDWMARLEEVLLGQPTPTLLVAHSLGCLLATAWAAHSQHTALVIGALLVAPPDIEADTAPERLMVWRPIERQRLPFRSIVVLSSDDPYGTTDRGMQMAANWGSELVSLGPCGHINGESELGAWPQGRALVDDLVSAWKEARTHQ
jgi:predicted alpha/beta hydrolase family esterase